MRVNPQQRTFNHSARNRGPMVVQRLLACEDLAHASLTNTGDIHPLHSGPALHHCHQDVKVLQLHPASNAIAQLHLGISIATLLWPYQEIALLMHSYIVVCSGTKGF